MNELVARWKQSIEEDIEIDVSEFCPIFESGRENDLLDLFDVSFPTKGEAIFERYLSICQKVDLSTEEDGALVRNVVFDMRRSYEVALSLKIHEDIENISNWVAFLNDVRIREVSKSEYETVSGSDQSDMLDVFFTFIDFIASRDIPFAGKRIGKLVSCIEELLHAGGLNDLLARLYVLAALGEGEMDLKSYPSVRHRGILIEVLTDEVVYFRSSATSGSAIPKLRGHGS